MLDKNRELALMRPLKTAMMLLVVLYHSCLMWAGSGWFDEPVVQCEPLGTFALWLNTFHVPSFVFASGYVHSYLRRETGHYGGMQSTLAHKARRLLLPYVFVALLWAAPAYGFFFGLDDLVGKFVLMRFPSQLWFLPMLLWCFVANEFVWRFSHICFGNLMLASALCWLSCWLALSFLNFRNVLPILAALIAFFFSVFISICMVELLGRLGPTRLMIGKG